MSSKTICLRLAMLVVVGASLVGCGNLTVTMGVLRPDVVRAELDKELVSRLLPTIVASTPVSIFEDVERLRSAHRQAYAELRVQYEASAAKLPQPAQGGLRGAAADLTGDFDRNTGAFYRDLTSDLRKYRAELIARLDGRYTVTPAEGVYFPTVDILRVWQKRVAQASSAIRGDIAAKVKDAAEVIQRAAAGALVVPDLQGWIRAEQSKVVDYVAQLSIQSSPAAYAVANADDTAWAERYNYVLARSHGGASDVAIKLDPATGNYLLKGLSFDPSDVAAVASKVTTQALLVSAQIAGVPIKQSAAPADGVAGKALTVSSGAMVDAQIALETRRQQEDVRKAALVALANVIVNEENDFKSATDETRRAAVAVIRNAFDKRASVIRPTAP
ncbi:hypothetical protein [Variovorax arabinosiphilus]|uniref:hypothetical protein n=1 Tax=Variovorax arabinosiphilus TaxID=3053498 RepID=UPI002576C4B9|nr:MULTISPECIES: hypothetical protein [unclassified Variovorax]MDM0122593.1 hypothetical protein [Variovorax sp. J2L1-78]MDM0130878.1 hypothetical protein [Variovorax sp. J2L1-63]MDM0235356.1 hypothetical protein [Variovorax sp. J2R1-6]